MNRRILPNNVHQQPPDPYGHQQSPQQTQQPPLDPREPPGGGGGGPSNPPGKPTYAKRGKITIVACVPCRKRKTKCDGKRPSCTQCQTRDGVCSYDMTDEQRKLTYLRDNVEQLQDRSNALESLLHTFQTASDEEAAEVFRRLRSGAAVHVVAEQVQAGHLLSGVGLPKSSFSASSQQSSRQPSSRDLTRLEEYDTLFNNIVHAEANELSHIVQRLRAGASVSTVIGAVEKGSLAPQPLMNQIGDTGAGIESDFSSQDQTFGMVKGADVTGTHASSSRGSEFIVTQIRHPWTQVTQDSALVEHLLTLYFTWQHCFFQSFPESLFRADMAAGRTKYCSSMLVNAICAAGCFLSRCEDAQKYAIDRTNLISKFFDEAERLLKETKTSSITTTAAIYLMSYVEGTRGNLSSLWMYSGRSSLMAIDLNLHLRQNRRNSSGSEDEELEIAREEKARSHAFWGCMHVDQTTGFTLGRLPNININAITVDLPSADDDEDQEPWEAYQMGRPNQPGARSTTFRQCAELSKILNSTLMMFFAPNVPLTGALLLEEYQKYLEWYRDLPSIVAKTEDAPPHVLCLHMYYHTAILLLFRPFLKATMTQSTVKPREVCREAANNVSEILERHRSLYDVSGIYMFQVHCLLTACTIHIVNLPSIASTKYLTEACNTFQDLIPRNEWARSSLRILRGLVQKWGLVLPLETEEAMYRDLDPSEMAAGSGEQDLGEDMSNAGRVAQWPRGPDPLATHPKGAYQSGSAMVPLDPRLSQAGSETSQPLLEPDEPSTKATPAKRQSPSGSSASNTSRAGPGSQKRQRILPSQQLNERNDLVPISGSGAGSGSGAQARQGAQQQAQKSMSPSNYLYSPLKGQAAPLLAPVHSSNAPAAGGSSSKAGESSQGSTGKKRQKGGEERAQGEQAGVEGLTFGDDWRDPFMGFLGQEE